MRFTRGVAGHTRMDMKEVLIDIRTVLHIESVHDRIREYRPNHLASMGPTRVPKEVYEYQPTGQRPFVRPRKR